MSNNIQGNEIDNHCQITGESGSATVSNPFLPHLGATLSVNVAGQATVEEIDATPSYNCQAAWFVAAVHGFVDASGSAVDAAANMAVIDMIYRGAGMLPRGGIV